MTTTTGAKPHPIFLAGRWVESPDPLVSRRTRRDPASPPAPRTTRRREQYEEAVDGRRRGLRGHPHLPAYERGAILREISAGIKARREELGRLIASRPASRSATRWPRSIARC